MKLARIGTAVGAACLVAVGAVQASTVIGLTLEDQARLSKYVVIGEVKAQQGVDDPANGLETEVTLVVSAALKGDVRAGQKLVFHTRSGELDGEVSAAIGEVVLHPGQKILVFVEEIDGRLYNIGLSYGVFNVSTDSLGRVGFTRAIEDGLNVVSDAHVGNGPFTIEDVRTRVAYAATHPRYDNRLVRDAFVGGGQP
jgi:hypothetical protein